jgi:hypothetical protein
MGKIDNVHTFILPGFGYTRGMRKKLILALTAGFVLGLIWVVAVRFLSYKNDAVHYHANFALYVNGVQDKFDNFTFYEEVQSCGSDEINNPRTRVHLHDNIGYVVHVHDAAATWGHLFANLGYTLGDNLVKNDDGVYIDGQDGNKLTFWLNGKEVAGAANRTIGSEDVLLINYGKEDTNVLQQRYDAIIKNADEYNKRNDPSSCTGVKPKTFAERLKWAVGLGD